MVGLLVDDDGGVVDVATLLARRQRKSEAATELVDAVIHCRFEQTDAQMDEVVKMRIIEVS